MKNLQITITAKITLPIGDENVKTELKFSCNKSKTAFDNDAPAQLQAIKLLHESLSQVIAVDLKEGKHNLTITETTYEVNK